MPRSHYLIRLTVLFIAVVAAVLHPAVAQETCANLRSQQQVLRQSGGAGDSWDQMITQQMQQMGCFGPRCPSNAQLCGSTCCNPGTQCSSRSACIPAGSVECSNGALCPQAHRCSRDNTKCLSQDVTECSNGTLCRSGTVCAQAVGESCLSQRDLDARKAALAEADRQKEAAQKKARIEAEQKLKAEQKRVTQDTADRKQGFADKLGAKVKAAEEKRATDVAVRQHVADDAAAKQIAARLRDTERQVDALTQKAGSANLKNAERKQLQTEIEALQKRTQKDAADLDAIGARQAAARSPTPVSPALDKKPTDEMERLSKGATSLKPPVPVATPKPASSLPAEPRSCHTFGGATKDGCPTQLDRELAEQERAKAAAAADAQKQTAPAVPSPDDNLFTRTRPTTPEERAKAEAEAKQKEKEEIQRRSKTFANNPPAAPVKEPDCQDLGLFNQWGRPLGTPPPDLGAPGTAIPCK